MARAADVEDSSPGLAEDGSDVSVEPKKASYYSVSSWASDCSSGVPSTRSQPSSGSICVASS